MFKRSVSLTIIVSIVMLTLVGRVGYVAFSGSYNVSNGYNSYKLTIDNLAPNIYTSDNKKLTNNKYAYLALVKPTAKCVSEAYGIFSDAQYKEILQDLKKGYPVLYDINENAKTNYIKKYKYYYNKNNCNQLISKECGGLLSYLPNSIGSRNISFSVDAMGKLLVGDDGVITDNNYTSEKGIQITLNSKIQNIAYSASEYIDSGCVIIMDVKNSNILACVNKPDNTYINKAFNLYSVGSVFKIVVAISALQNNLDINYDCTGSITVGDTTYKCQNNHKHGVQNLKDALANSCNCYFVNLALQLGDNILDTANSLGYNSTTNLYNDYNVKNANLPSSIDISSSGQLAMLGFGQGKLSVTPLQICNTLCTIANGGYYNQTKLVEASVDDNGNKKAMNYNKSKKVISSDISNKMIEYLRYVVTNGTASNAESKDFKSAGKTATAQTGQYINGDEILNTWFAGIYPYDNPKYAIVIMNEYGTSGSKDACPIFSTIVEKLNNM